MPYRPSCLWPLACCFLFAPAFTGAGPAEPAAVAFQTVTPNLVVTDLAKSLAFYRDVLGFTVVSTVPDRAPYVFAMLVRDGVTVMLNDRATAEHDLPALKGRALGGGATLYFKVHGADTLHANVRGKAPVVLPLVDQAYGMREFGVTDPDGYVLIFAEEKK